MEDLVFQLRQLPFALSGLQDELVLLLLKVGALLGSHDAQQLVREAVGRELDGIHVLPQEACRGSRPQRR